jgi:hypothetical protein
MEVPQNRRVYGKMEFLLLWPTYIGEKGRTFGQNIWDLKVLLGTPFGNKLGT